MQFTIVNMLGAFSPIILTAILREIWKEGQSRSLMLRMLPPERRRVSQAPQTSGDATADRRRQSRPLWSLRDCQLELLTEGVIHAFEASATAYKPDRVASNYPPGRVARQGAKAGARPSILLRTLERNADLLLANGAAEYPAKPEIDDAATLTYLGLARPAHGPGAA